MDIISRIEELQKVDNALSFTDNLELTKEQRNFVDLNTEETKVFYEGLSERRSGRTYSMLLRAIKLGLNYSDGRSDIGIFSRNLSSSKIAHNKFVSILEDNNLMDYVNKITMSFIELKNGVIYRFSCLNESGVRGIRLRYAFIDDWSMLNRDARYIEDCITACITESDGQAFFMCTN